MKEDTTDMAARSDELNLELYKIAVQTRSMEIALFWQRSNYFLVMNTAIVAGFFSLTDTGLNLLFSVMGFLVSLLWVAVNLGSKFWQSRWEYRLHKVESELAPGIDLFSASWETVQADVAASFGFRKRGWFHDLYKRGVLLKPSVTMMMTLLSVGFVVFWILATMLTLQG